LFPFVATHGFGLWDFEMWLLLPQGKSYGFRYVIPKDSLLMMRGDSTHAGSLQRENEHMCHMSFYPKLQDPVPCARRSCWRRPRTRRRRRCSASWWPGCRYQGEGAQLLGGQDAVISEELQGPAPRVVPVCAGPEPTAGEGVCLRQQVVISEEPHSALGFWCVQQAGSKLKHYIVQCMELHIIHTQHTCDCIQALEHGLESVPYQHSHCRRGISGWQVAASTPHDNIADILIKCQSGHFTTRIMPHELV
jgi:hypothetical protein